MDTKKYRHADLERKRSIFFQIGLILAIAGALVAFEWSTEDVEIPMQITSDPIVEEIELPRVIKVEEKKPEIVHKLEIKDVIKIVENTAHLDDVPDFISEPTDDPIDFNIPECPPEVVDEEVHVFVERMPEFPGGTEALMRYFATNIKYPVVCAELNVQGRVYISFVVDKDGSITNVEVKRSPDANLSKEAMRVVSAMPKWNPGKQGGRPVKVAYTVPVSFKLQ